MVPSSRALEETLTAPMTRSWSFSDNPDRAGVRHDRGEDSVRGIGPVAIRPA